MRNLRGGLILCGLAVAAYSLTTASMSEPGTNDGPAADSLTVGSSNERLVVFLGSSACPASTRDSLREDLRILGDSLQSRLRLSKVRVAMIGVSIDFNVNAGIRYLRELYPFQEVTVGRGFLNSASTGFLLGASGAALTVPQILILERIVEIDSTSITVGRSLIVRRIVGADSIHAWAQKGAPM